MTSNQSKLFFSLLFPLLIKSTFHLLSFPIRTTRNREHYRKLGREGKKKTQKMAHLITRSLTMSFIILLIVFTSSAVTRVSGEAFGVGSNVVDRKIREESSEKRNKRTWMNHGSFRGPRKRLVNGAAERPFQAQELPL